MSTLLERTRKINRLIQNAAGYPVEFDEMASVLKDILGCDVFVASRKGKVLGSSVASEAATASAEDKMYSESSFTPASNDQLLSVRDTQVNSKLDGVCHIAPALEYDFTGNVVTIVPVYGGGERLGTMVLIKNSGVFDEEDLILSEYSATVVGLEILRSKSGQAEEEQRRKASVQVALSTLSYSELEAVEHIFNELGGDEGLLVASKIADRVGITRSVIVNALRKFESAGVIESRSLGMKGTYIRVKNDRLLDELKKLRSR